ncbi:MAG: hypothetical protein JSV21_02150 [Nitrospirota bacterium]|nr:MAG: hypothetical protein JSV21_02150 [Nitrospirota bacterium]
MDRFSNKEKVLVAVIVTTLFLIELIIMKVLDIVGPFSPHKAAYIDAALLPVLSVPILYFLVYRSLTAQKEKQKEVNGKLSDMQEEMDQERIRWEHTVDSLPEMILLLDKDGDVISANRTAMKWSVNSAPTIKATDLHRFMHMDCDEDDCDLFNQWSKAWKRAQDGNTTEFDVFDDVLDKFLSVYVSPVTVSDRIDKGMVLVVAHDITSTKRMEEIILQRQKALRFVYEMAIALDDTQSVFNRASKHISDIFRGSGTLITQNHGDYDIVLSASGMDINGGDRLVIKGTPVKEVYGSGDIYKAGGSPYDTVPGSDPELWDDVKTYLGVPIKNSLGKTLGVVSVLAKEERDFLDEESHIVEIFARFIGNTIERETVTRQIKESQKMKVLGQMAAGVAHEVRNPLNAIMAVSEALAMDLGEQEEHKEFLRHIKVQVERLSNLMKDLLDLGRPIDTSEFGNVPVSALYKATLYEWGLTDHSKAHKVILDEGTEKGEYSVYGDARRLQQVFLNLLMNAAQHSPEGSDIVFEVIKPVEGFVRIVIKDRGSGIEEDKLDMIFEPFFTTRKGGSGMGLSLARHIIETHEGFISISNNMPPPGSTVEISLPVINEEKD